MATNQTTLVHVNEDYIDMELITSSSPNFFSFSTLSPSQNRDFEFQMTSFSNEKDSKTSPADDLFYKGKLLPLHLPPRLQMVQNLLENSNGTFEYVKSDSPFKKNTFPFTKNTFIPIESCNISTSESCRVNSEVAPDEYLFGWSSSSSFEKSWPKKLKQIKQFWLGQRLKASKTYLKSMFTKSGCSNKSCAIAAANNVGVVKKPKCKECQKKYLNVKKNPFELFNDDDDNNKHPISYAVMKTIDKEMNEDDFITHRKSFSGVVQRHCAKKSSSLSTSSSGSSSSSSSFSFSSAGYYDLHLFKRSISANSDLEDSVEGAIAHCKKSQMKQCSSKNNAPDGIRICSQFASKIAVCGNQEMSSLASTRG
ncbi:hypothetical protein TanjilG_14626 [Lupinus angustifolius]|uniref:Membrane-associated kinase regulator 4 n=1 Tax=Lupinus angustifolius TaxID=3871 RepID=A0A1J7HMI3_LUPAN|nr:PREDICTED: probable membrane-associated kinase regulator 4 [Lupinus angustifolius]OIW01627.1 hypothetical protein TanjilG_14626 [Lupinus angustifolius]